jgi:Sap, sulfolipid-1-addressing protein
MVTNVWETIGAMLPFAAGVALSPFPIIAVVLLLLAPGGKPAGVAFLAVRVLSVLVVVGVLAGISDLIEQGGSAGPFMAILRILVGVTLIVLAVRKWGGRPGADAEPKLPKWMGGIEQSSPRKAGILAFILSVGNLKELLLNAGAGLTIGNAALALGQTFAVVAIYTVIACATVGIPVAGFLIASKRIRAPLESARSWLIRNNAAILSVVLLIIGVALIGGGLGDL